MSAHFFSCGPCNIEQLGRDLERLYTAQGYQTQHMGDADRLLVQMKIGSEIEGVLGLQAAIGVTIEPAAAGILVMLQQQKWLDKVMIGTVGLVALSILWPLTIVAGVGALRQFELSSHIIRNIELLLQQQVHSPDPESPSSALKDTQSETPSIPVPPTDMFSQSTGYTEYTESHIPVRQETTPVPDSKESEHHSDVPSVPVSIEEEGEIPPAIQQEEEQSHHLFENNPVQTHSSKSETHETGGHNEVPRVPFCPSCGAVCESSDTFCFTCGGRLKTPIKLCPSCGKELRESAAFCSSCGYSFTHVTQKMPASSENDASPYIPLAFQDTSQAEAPPSEGTYGDTFQKPEEYEKTPEDTVWGYLTFPNGRSLLLTSRRVLVGRYDATVGGVQPDIDLAFMPGANSVSRIHAALDHIGSSYTITDLNSTNATYINEQRLEPNRASLIMDGDVIAFGTIHSLFHKA